MLSRRLFLGTTAGALGLFGFFGRLRFRPSRRFSPRIVGVLITGDGASISVSQDPTPRVLLHVHGEEKARPLVVDWINSVRRRYWLPDLHSDDGRLYAAVTVEQDQKGQWHPVTALASNDERVLNGKPAMILYGIPQLSFGGPAPASQTVVPVLA